MKLKICKNCDSYTLKEECAKCREKSKDAGYKFLKFWERPNIPKEELI